MPVTSVMDKKEMAGQTLSDVYDLSDNGIASTDISLDKFFALVSEVSNGDAPLLKYQDNDCIKTCIKTKWV